MIKKEIIYEKLRPDILDNLVAERSLECKSNKSDIIKTLKLDDQGLYVRDTTYEKVLNGYIVGIDVRNKNKLIEIGNIIQKKDAENLNRYSCGRLYYFTKQKLI